jgi:sulfur carrier protein
MAPLTMQITLNGQGHPLPAPTTLTLLLLSLGLADKPVVIELNRAAIFPRDFAETSVKNGDQIEIVTLAAGG